jgi:hypothetical protein
MRCDGRKGRSEGIDTGRGKQVGQPPVYRSLPSECRRANPLPSPSPISRFLSMVVYMPHLGNQWAANRAVNGPTANGASGQQLARGPVENPFFFATVEIEALECVCAPVIVGTARSREASKAAFIKISPVTVACAVQLV